MNMLIHKYKGFCSFVTIYILEAHPKNELIEENIDTIAEYDQPMILEERKKLCSFFVYETSLNTTDNNTVFVDNMENTCALSLGGWPTRFLIFNDYTITHISKEGPSGYDSVVLENYLHSLQQEI